MEVGGFFFDFEAVRTASRDITARRRRKLKAELRLVVIEPRLPETSDVRVLTEERSELSSIDPVEEPLSTSMRSLRLRLPSSRLPVRDRLSPPSV